MEEADTLKSWDLDYVFAGGYVRNENKDKLASLIDKDGNMEHFGNIRTVVGEYDEDNSILGWLSRRITVQNATAEGIRMIREAGADEAVLRLKSLEAFAKAADGKATKIIIPSEIQGMAGLAKSAAEIIKEQQ